MLNLGFKDEYKIVHITSEIGQHCAGGICTFMNELYECHSEDVGFVEVYPREAGEIIPELYTGMDKDLLILEADEGSVLGRINADIFVVHLWTFADLITRQVLESRDVVYVVHSVPTVEPWSKEFAFENGLTKRCFEHLCGVSTMIVCISEAEKEKLCTLYPQYEDKIQIVYNGISEKVDYYNENYKKSRKIFGYIGRVEKRKGLYELIKDITKYDVEFRVAMGKPDITENQKILQYLNTINGYNKVRFLGWCSGGRKQRFFETIDALVIPSLYEPFGYVALEAMQYGIPIICSGNGGLKEILSEEYRYLYNPYLEGDFDRVMNLFLNDDTTIVEEQVDLLKNQLKKFTSQNMVNNYNKTLQII